jgi:membrane fusion protein (multidrug efflux system)
LQNVQKFLIVFIILINFVAYSLSNSMKFLQNLPGFLFALSVIFMTACSTKSGEAPKIGRNSDQKPVTADAIVVTHSALENDIKTNGTLMPAEEVELRSETPGRIVSINFREGAHVSKGDLLVKIDDRELQAQLKKLQLDEKLAMDDVSRKEKLLEINAVSREEYDKAVNTLEVTRANIDLVETQISKTEIRAPFSGIVGLRQVSNGGYVSSATLVSSLRQVDPVKLEFAVPEKYREKLRPGTPVSFSIDGVNKDFRASVYAIEPSADPLTHSIKLRAMCPNPGNQLVPGAFARINIELDKLTNSISVPAEAIIPVIDGQKVLVSRNGKVASQKVETGFRSETMVQITKGLNDGDTVFISGLLVLKDDMKANPRIVNPSGDDTGGAE